MREFRSKAPIAAHFEDCLQASHRMCATIHADRPESEDSVTADDCDSRLKSWGHDSGASSRHLDHALRRTSSLSTASLDLLVQLSAVLQKANGENTPHLTKLQQDYAALDESGSSTTEVSQYLEDAVEIVSLLCDLLPNLRDPAPEDTYSDNLSSEDFEMDIALAKALFSKASHSLCERLGRANWRRRQRIRHEKRLARSLGNNSLSGVGLKAEKRGAGNSSKKWSMGVDQMENLRRNIFYGCLSDTGASVTPSLAETIFSRTRASAREPSTTSIADSDVQGHFMSLQPPDPPVLLILQSSFICPYCHHEIVVGDQVVTMNDWVDHIWLDLEPYICTFNDCSRANKTYATRDEWFRHELDRHRVPKFGHVSSLPAMGSTKIENRSKPT